MAARSNFDLSGLGKELSQWFNQDGMAVADVGFQIMKVSDELNRQLFHPFNEMLN